MNSSLLVVAGEVSGDRHTAGVLHALRRIRPELTLWGIGGPALREAGLETLHDIEEMAVMGLWEVLVRLPFFRRTFRETLAEAERRAPSAALLVDYPGFNLRLAAALKQRGIPVIYYVCPQVWAWHRSRIDTIARRVDKLLVLFPFEVDLFQHTGLSVECVGHPLSEQAGAAHSDPPPDWPGAPRIAILPGSRRQETTRILPLLLDAATRLQQSYPTAGFLVAAASEQSAQQAAAIRAASPRCPERLQIVTGQTRSVLRTADAAWVTSGTATLEAALQGCPMAIVYRTAALTYVAARAAIRIPHIGLVNIVAEREICPELIQYGATPSALVHAIDPLLSDTPERLAMKEGLAEVASRLGNGNPFDHAAAAIDRFLNNPSCPSKP